MSKDRVNLYDIWHTVKGRSKKNEVARDYFIFRKALLRYIELMKETMLNGYDFEIPGLGTFSIVKRKNFKLHKYHVIISRIGWEYLIVMTGENEKKIYFSACREFRVQLRDLLNETTKDFKNANS